MSTEPTFPAGIHAHSDVYAEIEKRDEIISKLSAELAACRAREAVTDGATQRYADKLKCLHERIGELEALLDLTTDIE